MHILDGVNLRGKRRTGDAKAAADNGAGKAQMEGAPAAKRGKPATAAQQPVPAAGKREERAVDSKAVPKRAAKGTNVASQARSKPAAREGAAAEKPAGKLVEKRADKPGRKAADQHVAAPTGKPTGKPTDTASNKPTVKPAGNTSGKPTGKSAVQPAGKPAGTAKASTKTAADGVQPKAKAAKVQPTAAKAQAKPANKPARQTPVRSLKSRSATDGKIFSPSNRWINLCLFNQRIGSNLSFPSSHQLNLSFPASHQLNLSFPFYVLVAERGARGLWCAQSR